MSLEALQVYAKEYYHHVAAFPRYISSIHSLYPNLKIRQVLLGKLIEEEQGKVMQSAKKGAKLLWGFLDGIMNINVYH